MSKTSRSFRSLVSGLLLLMLGAGAQAGQVRAELAGKLAALRSDDTVRVIIRCADKVDRRQFTDADIKLRRQRLLTALRDKADRCLATVDAVLRNRATDVTVLRTISGVAATVPASLVDTLARLPGVESVTLDATVVKPAGSTSTSSTPEWNLQAVRAPELWALGHDGSGAVVAVMDTGVDAYHPDIGPKWRGGTNSWFDPNGQHATPYDADGHGTWATGLIVGGTAGGTAIGIAPGALWIAVKIFDNSGQSLLSRIHQGFQWLLDPDGNPATDDAPDIVNNSWYLQGTVNACNSEFADDVALLRTAEIAVVFSGGNTGPSPDTSVSPSNDPQALAVGAVSASLAAGDFSGRGASACDGSYYPGVSAPGVAVRTADLTFGGIFPNSYRYVTGTSFAAPHVAGGLALLKAAMAAQGIPVTVSLLEAAVAQTATDLGSAGPDDTYGAGLLDLVNAHGWLLANAGTPQPGQLRFSASAYAVAENGGSIVLTVTRVGGSAGTITVNHATANGSAAAGSDYVATSGTLTFLDGETSKTIAISITDDTVYEGDETFSVSLSSPTGGATLGNPATAQVTITENETVNDPPAITSTPVTTAAVSTAYSYDVNATDPNAGQTLTYSLTTAPAGMAINLGTGLITWTPTTSQAGTHNVVVSVADNGAPPLSTTQSFTVTVNGPPVITSTPVTTATVGTAYSYDVNATDPNAGQTLTYSLSTAPTGMSINSGTGLITWTPTSGQAGANSVTARVTDNGTPALFTTQSFTVTAAAPAFKHVGDLDGATLINSATTWQAIVTITVHDQSHNPVQGVVVSRTWSPGGSGGGALNMTTCTTNAAGQCQLSRRFARASVASVTMTVSKLTGAGGTYQSASNHDPDGDSTGTTITVTRP